MVKICIYSGIRNTNCDVYMIVASSNRKGQWLGILGENQVLTQGFSR